MNLQKLKNASLHELRVRASQRVAAFSERRGWSSLVKLPENVPNAEFSNERFFAGFRNLEKSASELRSRWPETAHQIIEQANRICDGRFDLLGFKNLSFGDPIDWHFEPVSGKRIPLQHWSKLDYLDAGVAGDKKITWELNRHQYFIKFGQAYALTGDERYAKVFVHHLESWMEKHVGIEHDETVQHVFARHPQRIQAASLGVFYVLDETDLVVAFFADAVRTETNHNHDLRDVQTPKRLDLPVQQRRAANIHQTFRFHGRAVEPGTFSCCEYDCFHDGWLSSFADVPGTEPRLNTSFTLLKYQSRSFRLIANSKNRTA